MPCGSAHVTAHLWIVASDPDIEQKVLIVNITTQRPYSDNTTVLKTGDHPFIGRPSVVSYKDSMIRTVADIEQAKNCGIASPKQACSPGVLARVQAGFAKSQHVPYGLQQYYLRRFPPPPKPDTLPKSGK